METYRNLSYEHERALYGIKDSNIIGCNFMGKVDGESPLKECTNILVDDCNFKLRYPLWHVHDCNVKSTTFFEPCRAPFWYDSNLCIVSSNILGVKSVRECTNVTLKDCEIESVEFGWKCNGIDIQNCNLTSEYPFFDSKNGRICNLNMKAKYSFQYVQDMVIENSNLDTKDAFWHCNNIVVKNSIVKGEYLGWYSNDLKFINCNIIGTQPLCYANNLVLENCTMIDCDLSFENSTVQADITGKVDSIKNPKDGTITADDCNQIILDTPTTCKINILHYKDI